MPADWLEVIFNPSFPYRLVHMVLAAYLTTAFVVGGVGAFHLLRDQHVAGARVMFSMAMWMAALVAPIQILAGDQHGLNTLEYQPAKVMAMEGHYQSHKDGAPLILFGMPNQAAGRVDAAIEIPKLSSLILKHALDAPLNGLDTVPRGRLAAGADHVLVVPDHGRAGLPDDGDRRAQPVGALARHAVPLAAAASAWRSPWRRRDSSPCWPAGSPPRSDASRSPSTACCAPSTRPRRSRRPAVGSSLLAFVIVYFAVFGAGVIYILRLMRRAAASTASEDPQRDVPARAAGITPAAAVCRRASAP